MSAAIAFPEGAPWGAANPAATEDCANCHFGADPVFDSASLELHGLPDTFKAGALYDLRVAFEDEEIVVAGFQLFADAGMQPAGSIVSALDDVEFIGAAIRTTAPVAGPDSASWTLQWRAPASTAPIVFYVAASAANDDGSPLGDTIHYRMYVVAAD